MKIILSLLLIIAFSCNIYALTEDLSLPVSIEANFADINQEDKIGIYKKNVKIQQGSTNITSELAHVFLDNSDKLEKAIAFGNKDIKAHFWTKPKPDQEILHAYAKTIELYPQKRFILLKDESHINQAKSHITSDKVHIFVDENDKVDKAIAFSNKDIKAHFWTKPEPNKEMLHANAKIIEFFPKQDLIILKGDASIKQGTDTYKAPILKYNIKKESISSPKSDEGKTVITLHNVK